MNDNLTHTRKTADDFNQELLNLYDSYAHGVIERREFLDKAGKFAVGGLTAAMILKMLLFTPLFQVNNS